MMLDGRRFGLMSRWQRAGRRARFLGDRKHYSFTPGQAAAFSSDGRRMIFTASTTFLVDSARLDIYRMNIDGRGLRRLAVMPYQWAKCLRWNPRGNTILSAEQRYLPGKPQEAGIWLRDANWRVLRKLADGRSVSFCGMDWSPDGTRVIYQVADSGYTGFANLFEHPDRFGGMSRHCSIWVMRRDGTAKRKLLDNACHPNWRRVSSRP
jgi:Tol biopolymer transport system component